MNSDHQEMSGMPRDVYSDLSPPVPSACLVQFFALNNSTIVHFDYDLQMEVVFLFSLQLIVQYKIINLCHAQQNQGGGKDL